MAVEFDCMLHQYISTNLHTTTDIVITGLGIQSHPL
ncbi:Uncharacterised protein [Mycobacteroides abscessus]|nr:Uncharacterised protein [Mycobacteroides abscessus]